jgi:hypothetical protein
MTAQGGIGTRPARIRVGSASKPSATAGRPTYFELSRPFLSHASPRHPAGRPASLFMTVRHGTRYAAMSYVGPPRLRVVRLRGRRPSVPRHGAADAYSADAPEPPPRSWSQRVVESRCQDARGPADLYPPGALAVDGGLRSDQVTMSAGPHLSAACPGGWCGGTGGRPGRPWDVASTAGSCDAGST